MVLVTGSPVESATARRTRCMATLLPLLGPHHPLQFRSFTFVVPAEGTDLALLERALRAWSAVSHFQVGTVLEGLFLGSSKFPLFLPLVLHLFLIFTFLSLISNFSHLVLPLLPFFSFPMFVFFFCSFFFFLTLCVERTLYATCALLMLHSTDVACTSHMSLRRSSHRRYSFIMVAEQACSTPRWRKKP